MRITFAGCSTRSVMLRAPSASSLSPPSDGSLTLAMPPGPMTTTCGSSGVSSGCCVVMPPTIRVRFERLNGEDDLPGVLAGLHDPVGLGHFGEGQCGVHQALHGAVGDERPHVLDDGRADRGLL